MREALPGRAITIALLLVTLVGPAFGQPSRLSVFVGYPALPWLYDFRQGFYDNVVIGDIHAGLGYSVVTIGVHGETDIFVSLETSFTRISSSQQRRDFPQPFVQDYIARFVLNEYSVMATASLHVPDPLRPIAAIGIGLAHWDTVEDWDQSDPDLTGKGQSTRPAVAIRTGIEYSVTDGTDVALLIETSVGLGNHVARLNNGDTSLILKSMPTSVVMISVSTMLQ